MERPRINISDVHRKKLYESFEVSRQTINAALNYYNNSPTAKAIRAKAKELLKSELKKVMSYED